MTPETTPQENLPEQPVAPETTAPETAPETLSTASEVRETPTEPIREDTPTTPPPTKHGAKREERKQAQAITDDDQRVQALLKIALNQGLTKAAAEAKKTKNAFVIDRFHDELVDQLKEQLREEKKLKEL